MSDDANDPPRVDWDELKAIAAGRRLHVSKGEEPDRWQRTADVARFWLLISAHDDLRRSMGDRTVDFARCEAALHDARARGYTPRNDEVLLALAMDGADPVIPGDEGPPLL